MQRFIYCLQHSATDPQTWQRIDDAVGWTSENLTAAGIEDLAGRFISLDDVSEVSVKSILVHSGTGLPRSCWKMAVKQVSRHLTLSYLTVIRCNAKCK